MSKTPTHVSLSIAGRSFKLAAPESEMARLELAAKRLDAVCKRIAPTLTRSDPERLLLLAALELASSSDDLQPSNHLDWEARVRVLRERLDQAVAASKI